MTRPYSSLKFRKWIELENAKQLISEAIEGAEFPERVFGYLSVAYEREPKEGSWQNTISSLTKAFQTFSLKTNLPLIKYAPQTKDKEVDWDYPERSWNRYSHILAQAYGWGLEYIADLEAEEALGHVQEVLTDQHLEQEFAYSLSELAYPYNKATKKGEFKPMPRPYWMRPASRPTKKVKIKRSLLPQGYVIDASGLGAELGGWNEIIQKKETKTANSSGDAQTISPSS